MNGLDGSFDAFVARASPRLTRTAYLLSGSRMDAEDLVQQALVRTARRWGDARVAPDAYAYRVLVNLTHDRRRRASRRVQERPLNGLGERSPDGHRDLAESVGEHAWIVGAVRELPLRQREIVLLRFFAGLSVADVAGALGVSEGTVKTHTSRALERLRIVLADESAAPVRRETEV